MKLLSLMYSKESISFKEQDILNDQSYFRRTMEILIRWHKAEKVDGVCADMRKHVERFRITIEGRMWVEKNVFDYRKCV